MSLAKSTFTLPLDKNLLPEKDTLLIAVSGGADSMALLHALVAANYTNIIVGHINHGTRGAENETDAQFVQDYCNRVNVPFHMESLHVENHSEAALRNARYAALLRLAEQHHCQRIATAHTASDVLESLLLNFLRDASILGWNGIAAERPLTAKVLLVRPLLQTSREEVRQYLSSHQQTWQEDSSNKSTFYKRNAIRQQLLPVLDQLVPRGLEQLARQSARTALIAREENAFWEAQMKRCWNEISIEENAGLIVWNGERFAALYPAMQRRLLRYAVRYFCDKPISLDFERIEEARNHIMLDGRNKVWQWRGGISVHWTGPASGRRIRISRTAVMGDIQYN